VKEDAAREQLATCTRIFAMHGLLGMFGHSSVAMLRTAFILEDNARKLLEALPPGAVQPLSPEECRRLESGYPEARAHWAYLAADERRWDRQRATGVLRGV
jgi:hypothetical protein